MDSLAALALATEKPKESLLERMPQNRDDYIVSRKMIKHILYMAIYQCVVLFVILFAGEYFIPEPNMDLRLIDKTNPYIVPGRLYTMSGEDLYKPFEKKHGASRHLTFVFNTFVFMQIFNMIASRKIHDEINIFEGTFGNPLFVGLWIVIAAGQVAITQFGGVMFVVNEYGLAPIQWGYSLGISITCVFIDLLLKFIPDSVTPSLGQDTVFNRKYGVPKAEAARKAAMED